MQARALSAALLLALAWPPGPRTRRSSRLKPNCPARTKWSRRAATSMAAGSLLLMIDDEALTVTWGNHRRGAGSEPAFCRAYPRGAGRCQWRCQRSISPACCPADRSSDDDLAGVLANPAGWYVNIHTAEFEGGAIRGQLSLVSTPVPEPSSLALLGLGLLGLGLRRRQRVESFHVNAAESPATRRAFCVCRSAVSRGHRRCPHRCDSGTERDSMPHKCGFCPMVISAGLRPNCGLGRQWPSKGPFQGGDEDE